MRIMLKMFDRMFDKILDDSPTRLFKQFLADQSGATSIEYALIAAGIALAIIAAVNSLGTTLSKKFTSINSSLK